MNYAGSFEGFVEAIKGVEEMVAESSERIDRMQWQGVDVSKDPSARCYELRGVVFSVDLVGDSVDDYRISIGPNLPWADEHFEERVSGKPMNPPPSWEKWPWASSAGRFLSPGGKFDHTYPERYWPKEAGDCPSGIRDPVGDLGDVVLLLERDPTTRQAYVPIFFPEDTGGKRGRKPCTLGYHFLRTGDCLDVFYPMRSCDFARHFRDDCYLTVRLLLWVLEKLRGKLGWEHAVPGEFSMWITSLHVFENDLRKIRQRSK